MRYYLSDTGGAMAVSGDTGVFPVTIPEGYREVTQAEYLAATGAEIVPLPPEPAAKAAAPAAAPAKARRAKGK
ncbi:hypothetical protein [Streptomyces sp. NPDC007346]|uniref:hypothetical protein n=1 Tax=Streptomyces sp. NPDC007346 TaxID=3154682 RepID=UPI00345663C2